MNEQLQKQLAEMLSKLTAVAQDAGKFAADQIPPLVQEKIAFGRISETIQLVIVVVLVAAMFRIARRCFRAAAAEDSDGYMVGGALAAFGTIVFALGAAFQINTTLMVWMAPRLYIVEWLREMARG